MDNEAIWTEVLGRLRSQMTNATFTGIFTGSKLLPPTNGDDFLIQVETEAAKEWIDNRLGAVVARALAVIISPEIDTVKISTITKNKAVEVVDKTSGFIVREKRQGNRYYKDREFVFNGYSAVIGPQAAAVYDVLVAHVGNDDQCCTRYYATLALYSGVSERQVMREIKNLERHHLIAVDRSQKSKPCIFSLLDVSEWKL